MSEMCLMIDAKAHPRVCGENKTFLAMHGTRLGSSPRVRGKRGQSRYARPPRGLIPACAGKTRRRKRWKIS